MQVHIGMVKQTGVCFFPLANFEVNIIVASSQLIAFCHFCEERNPHQLSQWIFSFCLSLKIG